MADPLSTIKEFVGYGFKIMSLLDNAKHNAEDCRTIHAFLLNLSAIAHRLRGLPKIMVDDLMRDTADGLHKALKRASEFVAKCEHKGVLRRAFNAKDIAEKLRGVCLDVLLNMNAVQLNMNAMHLANDDLNSSKLAELKEIVAKILHIVATQPTVHLQEEVQNLVKDDQISSQIKNKGAARRTVVASSQNKNKREAEKTGVASGFMLHVKNLKAEVYRAMLTAITCDPASCQIISRSIEDTTLVTSIDAHPTKPWIVTGHEGGSFSIWDYQKQVSSLLLYSQLKLNLLIVWQETVMKLQVNEVPDKGAWQRPALFQYIKETSVQHSVFLVKFTAEGKRLVVGDGRGYIYVYDSTDTKLHEVEKFRAYDKKSVNSLAAHPTKPYLLLSSSSFSRNIKLWDSSENWKFQNFKVKPENTYYVGVHSVKFNPRDTNTFACVTDEDKVKVWNIKTSILETTLKGPFVMADYFFNRGHQHLMVTLKFDAHNSEIWDLKTRKVVHTLSVSGHKTTWVACHPKLPILVTMLDDGTVCLWDASTYRLEKMVHNTNRECRDLVFVRDTNGLPRLAMAFKTMIAIVEVNLPIANTSNASGRIQARQRRPSRRLG